MNIFKVFASAKKGFQEEYASAIIAWLLNPAMEHGLGYAFLVEFLTEVSTDNGIPKEMGQLAANMRTHLRSNSRSFAICETFLELNVVRAFIDVVVNIEIGEQRWTIAIENKINSTSASDRLQLTREYQGLKETDEARFMNRRILMVFLVPEERKVLDWRINEEWAHLKTDKDDGKVLMTWGVNDKRPSISKAICSLLNKEGNGDIEPIHESVRHTLKALRRFIADGFAGYPYEAEEAGGGKNPKTESRLSYDALLLETQGWVGVQHGVGGLLRIMTDAERTGGLNAFNRTFQFTKQDMSKERNWLELGMFKAIAKLDGSSGVHDISWFDAARFDKLTLPASLIYFVATRTTMPFYIGISGGEDALRMMTGDEIDEKRWGVRTQKMSSQWIRSDTFCGIYEAEKLRGHPHQ